MIVENFPQLAELDSQQKLILAGELWQSVALPNGTTPELSKDSIRLLEDRLKHLKENPDNGIRWEGLRERANRD